ncbi:MAG: EI24 domain-containing protein [Bacteroidota bacterium]
MFGQFFKGLGTYSLTFKALSQYKLWHWVILPGLLSLLFGGAMIYFGITKADDLAHWMIQIWPFEIGKEVMELVLAILSGMIVIILVLLTIKYVVIVLASPFMGTLSEQLEARLTGKPTPAVSFGQMLKDILRGLRLALRNIVRELFYTLLLTLAGLVVPVIGQIISGVLIFMVQGYFAGFGNLDFTLERRRYSIKQSVDFANSYRWLATGNGIGFLLILLIPVAGLVLAPGLGTAAATIDGVEVLDQAKYRQRLKASLT